MPQVSVVMPVYNAGAVVADAIASVRSQTSPDWELIAVDDGSDDESLQTVQKFAETDSRIRVLRNEQNCGAGPTRNRGIAASQGRYVAFLDADDMWHPEKLSRQVALMKDRRDVLSCTAYVRQDMLTGQGTVVGVPTSITRAELLHTNVIGCSTAIYDQEFFGRREMPKLARRQDFAFWLQLLSDTPCATGYPMALTTYRQHAGSISASKSGAALATWRMYRDHLGLPVLKASWYFGNYAARGVLRHKFPEAARSIGWLPDAANPPLVLAHA